METVVLLNIFGDIYVYLFSHSAVIYIHIYIYIKLKRTVFIQNRDFVLQYTLFKRLRSKKNSFFFKDTFKKFKETLFSKDVLNG